MQSHVDESYTFFFYQVGYFVIVIAFIFSTQYQDGFGLHALQGIPTRVYVGCFGVIDVIHPFHAANFLQTMLYAFEVAQGFVDAFLADTCQVGGDSCCHRIEKVVCAGQGQFFLFHVEGDWFGETYFVFLHIGHCPFFFPFGKRIAVGMDAMFMQLTLDDGVVIPKDESIFRSLILYDAEFGIYIVLHFVIVSVQMVGSDVHQYGNVGMKIIHIVQLEAAQLDYIVIIIAFCYLKSQTLTDVSGKSHVQSRFLKDMIDQ